MRCICKGSFISSLSAPILVLDGSLAIIAASDAMTGVFEPGASGRHRGCDPGELASFLEGSEELSGHIKNAISRLTVPGARDKFRWENNPRIYNVTVSSFSARNRLCFTVLFEDCTDHVMMMKSNDRARGYLESIMSSLHLGIVVTDRELLVTNINTAQQKFCLATGKDISLIDVVGQPLSSLFPDEASILGKVKTDVLETGAVFGGIVEHCEAAEGEIAFALSFSPLFDEAGNIVGMIRACEDITEKEKLEQQLHKAEMRSMEADTIRKVVVTLNHEINNALLPITANAEMLLRTPASADHREALESVLSCAEKIADVTRQLGSIREVKTKPYLAGGPDMVVAR